MKPSTVTKQTDFSAGEVDVELKRNDEHPYFKTGARQMNNWRILNSRGLSNRPGRRLLAVGGFVRTDEVLMAPGTPFYLQFQAGVLAIYNSSFANVFSIGAPWSGSNLNQIVWDVLGSQIFLCFPGMNPLVLTWNGGNFWTSANYVPRTAILGSQKRSVFFRVTPAGTLLQSSAYGPGPVTLTVTGANNFDNTSVGTILRFTNRQIAVLAVNVIGSPANLTGNVLEPLFPAMTLAVANANFTYEINDVVIGAGSGAKGIVFATSNTNVDVQLTASTQFIAGENVVGPNGIGAATVVSVDAQPGNIAAWDEEVFNTFRGFPASCFVDNNRLGFCDFPSLPGLIAWSAVGDPFDLYTDQNNVFPNNAIQELVPTRSRVMYVVPGMESSEFVFCDNAIFSIPISATTPLQPGSVSFLQLTGDGALPGVKPQRAQQSIVFVGPNGNQIKAVQAIGAYTRPYVVDDISDLRAHLIKSPIAIAIPSSVGQFEERYIYLLNADATITVGKYQMKTGVIDQGVGWNPWSGNGMPTWVFALNADVLISSSYSIMGNVLEIVDATQFLDAAILVNNLPANFVPPGGAGPLFFIPSGSVDLMDGGRMMGTYQVDASGHIIPQNNAGENLTSSTLTAGQAWTATLEPFVPMAQGGQDVGQRVWPRRLKRAQAYVRNSTGFLFAKLFSGSITPTSPAPGTIMTVRRISTWQEDENPTQPPPLREQSYLFRPLGYSHDPRYAIVKDTPGPLEILELDNEVTV
jgi:hypothetical protein